MNVNPLSNFIRLRRFGCPACVALLFCVLALFTSSGVSAAAAAAATKAGDKAPTPQPFVVPKSEFVDDYKSGRDPFFPNSRRRNPAPPTPVVDTRVKDKGAAAETVPIPSFASSLYLKGISKGIRGRRFALINNITFAPGEQYLVKTLGGTNLVRCLEIKDVSVTVQIEGSNETKNLYLPQK
jgi:hypothetical protein